MRLQPFARCLAAVLPVLAQHARGPVAELAGGTSVVVLRSPRLLLAAVDSKETHRRYGASKAPGDERESCKLARIGPYFAIVAGISHGPDGFNALDIAARAWKPGDSIEDLGEKARFAIPARLIPLLESIREIDPDAFSNQYPGQAALQLTLLGSDRGVTEVLLLDFIVPDVVTRPLALSIRTTHCPGDCSSSDSAYFLGTHEAIDAAVRRDEGLIRHPDERNIEALIGLEYAARPDVVGGPLSIVRIDRDGSQLIRKGACAADGP